MPYVDKGARICKANINLDAQIGDIIITYPALLKINKNLIVYPPLSKISDSCGEIIESPSWIDGYKIKGDEKIEFVSENITVVKGELNIKCSKILTAFTLKKFLDNLEIPLSKVNTKGYPIVTINDIPLVSIDKDKVIIYSKPTTPIIRTFAYSLFYYIRSSSELE
ncbi:hypothetical protein SJAV_22880 [Sulfurisphaera javensis]|uniref:Uncharacterized protein n=1 Tax=Sulfurisphaera javensis TaxID=2049879 RepID=A0AAT9GTZ6_9CREN